MEDAAAISKGGAGGVVKDDRQNDDMKKEEEEDHLKKHLKEKEKLNEYLKHMGQTMKHYINCGFNLLLYGVGSKRNFLNYFALSQLHNEPKVVINGFHSATSIKCVTNPLLNFA